jgi:Flp pilus assembly protein TadD
LRVPQRKQTAEATLRIVLPDTIEIHAGWSKEVPVAAYRGALDCPVTVQFEGLPAGVTLPPVIIPARCNRATACVRAENEARSVESSLRVTARCGPQQQTQRPITLIVHANPSLAFRTKGHRLLASGKPAEAIGAFSRALEVASGDPIVLNNRGVAHALLGQLDSAVADYTAAIRLSPGDALVRHNRGVAHARQKNMTRALLDFDTAIRLKPNYAPAYRSRAELYEQSGNPARAAADRIKADQISQAPNPSASPQLTTAGTPKYLSVKACDRSPSTMDRAGSFPKPRRGQEAGKRPGADPFTTGL